jgi:hypothetical protein
MPLASSAVTTPALVSTLCTGLDTFPDPTGTAESCSGSTYGFTAGSTTPVPSAASAGDALGCAPAATITPYSPAKAVTADAEASSHRQARRPKALPAMFLVGT